ncbi:MAG: patatin-like phospholipase family protein [Rickettsiaceae bacterium H1]|nr:patatin-like phospholipase family protein [Rickettsiaceae bacterium H1]
MFYRTFFCILYLLFLSFSPLAFSATVNKNFHNLVFAGGGVLGVAYVGALEAIEKHAQSISNIENVVGTSIGAVFATITSLRYTTAEMKQIVNNLDFKKFADQGIISVESKDIFGNETVNVIEFVKLLLNERESYGANSGNFLEYWVEKLIAAKVRKSCATFRDLHENNDFAELYVIAANITDNKVEIFSFEHTPDIVVSKAVRASASVPIVFDVVKIGKKVFIDGGMYSNYPIDFFNNKGKYRKHQDTLGLNFVNHKAFKNFSILDNAEDDDFDWEKYLSSIITPTFISQDFNYMESANLDRSIIIDNLDITPFDFNLSHKQKQALFKEGYKAASEYFRY